MLSIESENNNQNTSLLKKNKIEKNSPKFSYKPCLDILLFFRFLYHFKCKNKSIKIFLSFEFL